MEGYAQITEADKLTIEIVLVEEVDTQIVLIVWIFVNIGMWIDLPYRIYENVNTISFCLPLQVNHLVVVPVVHEGAVVCL